MHLKLSPSSVWHMAWCSNWSSWQFHFPQILHWYIFPPWLHTSLSHSEHLIVNAPASWLSRKGHAQACSSMHFREWHTKASQKSQIAPTNFMPVTVTPECFTRQSVPTPLHFIRPQWAQIGSLCTYCVTENNSTLLHCKNNKMLYSFVSFHIPGTQSQNFQVLCAYLHMPVVVTFPDV